MVKNMLRSLICNYKSNRSKRQENGKIYDEKEELCNGGFQILFENGSLRIEAKANICGGL